MAAPRPIDARPPEPRGRWWRWLLAPAPPLVALAVHELLPPRELPYVWVLFYPAVFVSFWIAGARPGLLVTALSALMVLWRLVPPGHTFANPAARYFPAVVFLATGVLFALFHDRLRRARQRSAAAATALRRARDEIASLVEQAPDGIFVADLDGRYTDVNGAGCRLLGYERHELLGMSIVDLLRPEDVAPLLESKQRMLAGRPDVAEWTLRRKDGSLVPVEVSAKILADGRWQGFVRDISARRQLEEALRASLVDLERAQSVAKVGSWRLDVRHDVLRWSDEEYRIFGVAPGTPMSYEKFLACVHPDDRAFVERAWSAGLRGELYDIEHRTLVGDEVRWVREKADLQFDERAALVGGIGISQDITERKELEGRLREARERHELALRGADLGSWDWSIASGRVVINARWCEMRGFRPEEVKGHVDSWIAGVHPDDWPRVQEVLGDHFAGRIAEYETEHRVKTKSGEWIWVLDRGKVFARDEKGEPARMVGTELDITHRKRVEEELRLAEAKSSGILSISADAIISVDEELRITLFNEGAEKIFGWSRAEVIGAPFERLLPERFRAVHRGHVKRFAAEEMSSRRMGKRGMAIVGLRKNGEEFPADAAISRLGLEGARILTVALRDITEQRRLEDEQTFLAEIGSLLASSLDLEATMTAIGGLATRALADACIVYGLDEDGQARRLEVALRGPGRDWIREALLEAPVERHRSPEIWSELEANRSVLLADVSPEMIASFGRSEAHLRALRALSPRSIIMAPLFAHGGLVGAMALIASAPRRAYGPTDARLAEQVAQRAALALDNARHYADARRAIKTRDDVLGVVAHDLRNPLATILMQATLLRRRGGGAEGPAERIERSATRMNRLIQDLLDVARMEGGRLGVARGRVSARQAVSDSVEAQAPLAEAASLELDVDLASDLPEVWADRDRLHQVFENLIGNAIKFTHPGGTITVGAVPRDDHVLFWVSDTGSGIAPDDIPFLFDRFWQARKTEHLGAGLGLPIVKGIVEAHDGRIWVESVVGRGSTFYFTMPKAREVTEGRAQAPGP